MLVRDFLAGVTDDDLAGTRKNPWPPEHPETVLSCLHTIVEEEWEHHRYAVRDLDVIEATSTAGLGPAVLAVGPAGLEPTTPAV